MTIILVYCLTYLALQRFLNFAYLLEGILYVKSWSPKIHGWSKASWTVIRFLKANVTWWYYSVFYFEHCDRVCLAYYSQPVCGSLEYHGTTSLKVYLAQVRINNAFHWPISLYWKFIYYSEVISNSDKSIFSIIW